MCVLNTLACATSRNDAHQIQYSFCAMSKCHLNANLHRLTKGTTNNNNNNTHNNKVCRINYNSSCDVLANPLFYLCIFSWFDCKHLSVQPDSCINSYMKIDLISNQCTSRAGFVDLNRVNLGSDTVSILYLWSHRNAIEWINKLLFPQYLEVYRQNRAFQLNAPWIIRRRFSLVKFNLFLCILPNGYHCK